ncbi:MAG: hypothetical protein QGD94_05980 [Planctomycetia bacterium]|nr:hypothetical protein [Planctomycetia bacterium]
MANSSSCDIDGAGEAAEGHDGAVLLVMGDKVTRPEVVRRLLACAAESEADVVLTTLPKGPRTTAGRVVTGGGGKILGIVELKDIQLARRESFPAARCKRIYTARTLKTEERTQ